MLRSLRCGGAQPAFARYASEMTSKHDHAKSNGIIDVHCHVVPLDLPLDPSGGKNSAVAEHALLTAVTPATFVAGPTTRKFDDRSWLASRRIDYMDQHGIAVQVLSPLPELLGYWFEPSATAVLCTHTNDTLARMVEAHPTRLAALGGLPMNDVRLAIEEARRLKRLGFAGVELGSNASTEFRRPTRRFEEVFAALHDLELAVFVHGVRPATAGRLVGPDVLAPIVGIPMDTALCVASFIGARTLERLPALRARIQPRRRRDRRGHRPLSAAMSGR